MAWNDISYLYVKRIEINDLEFLNYFSMEKCDVRWDDFLQFLELFFNRERWFS
jgi:hypothetical protein